MDITHVLCVLLFCVCAITVQVHRRPSTGFAYRVVSVEEAAAALCVWHTRTAAHHEAGGTLAALHTRVARTLGRGGQVSAGGGARRHAWVVDAVGPARHDLGVRGEGERGRERYGVALGEM